MVTAADTPEAENWFSEYVKRPAPYKPPEGAVVENGVEESVFLSPYIEPPVVNGFLVVPYWKSKKNTRPEGKFIG